jgi:hypothetical protein
MTALIFGQSTQPLSPTTIGVIVLALIFLSRWLWDYNRSRREEAQQFEPKANPALHHTFATKGELERLERDVAKIEEEQRDDIAALHKRIDAVPDRVIALLKQTKGLIE